MRRGVLVAVITASLIVVVAASGAVPRWTPKQMQAAVKHKKFGAALIPDFPRKLLLDTRIITVTSAKCRGLGSHTKTGYALFQCHVIWDSPNLGGGPFAGDFWTVPWTKSLCITDVSRGTCPPPKPLHPLPGDPRTCGNLPICIGAVAELAARQGRTLYNESCVAGAVWTTYNCTWNAGGATVRFVRHTSRWTTNVTPQP
jgi:hypothetical protein